MLDGGLGEAYTEWSRMLAGLLGTEAWIYEGQKELLMPILYYTPSQRGGQTTRH
jgi:hypothetical protein